MSDESVVNQDDAAVKTNTNQIESQMDKTEKTNLSSQSKSLSEIDSAESIKVSQPVKVPLFITAYLFLIMALYAVSIMMVGPIMPSVIADYQIRLSQGGLMTTFQSIGGVLAVMLVGVLADRFKKTWLIFVSFLIFGLALLLVSVVNIYTALLLIFFIFGLGSRMSDTVLNAYVSDLYQARRGYYLNLLHTFFGIGALSGPIYVRFILARNLPWGQVFLFLGIVCVILILFFPLVLKLAARKMNAADPHDLPAVHHQVQQSSSIAPSQSKPLSHLAFIKGSPVIWLLCLMMILYLAHQAVLSVWIPMYMESDLLVSPTFSGLTLSVMWLGIIVGRMVSAHLTDKVHPVSILIFGNLFAALLTTLGILPRVPVLMIICLGIAGFLNGATIPLLITIASDRYPQHTGTTSSIIFLSGAFATMIFPWLAGRLAELYSFQIAMSMTWVSLFILFFLGLLLRKAMIDKPF